MSVPWIKWYPADWRADPKLRLCGLSARGLWVEMIGYMHEAIPYGYLLIHGSPPTDAELASLVGVTVAAVRVALVELERRQVFSRDEAGRIYSRRMVRDAERHLRDKAHGKTGGNPYLKPLDKAWVNPPDNGTDKVARARAIATQKLEARELQKAKTKATREPASPFALPDWVPRSEWAAFDAMRKAKSGKAWTDDGRRFAVDTLEKLREAGEPMEAVLRKSVERSWSGLFALKKEDQQGRKREPTLAEKRVANMERITGKTNGRGHIEGTAERVDSGPLPALPGDIREPSDDDVGRRRP